jgi:hypothetical protein
VPDRGRTLERGKVVFREYLRHQAGMRRHLYALIAADGNTGAFLSAVLQCEQRKEDQSRCIQTGGEDSEDAATFTHEGPFA